MAVAARIDASSAALLYGAESESARYTAAYRVQIAGGALSRALRRESRRSRKLALIEMCSTGCKCINDGPLHPPRSLDLAIAHHPRESVKHA